MLSEEPQKRDPKKMAQELAEVLEEHREDLEKVIYKPYSRVLLEAAIPAALVVVGVVAVAAAVVFIDRRVGVDPSKPQVNPE